MSIYDRSLGSSAQEVKGFPWSLSEAETAPRTQSPRPLLRAVCVTLSTDAGRDVKRIILGDRDWFMMEQKPHGTVSQILASQLNSSSRLSSLQASRLGCFIWSFQRVSHEPVLFFFNRESFPTLHGSRALPVSHGTGRERS